MQDQLMYFRNISDLVYARSLDECVKTSAVWWMQDDKLNMLKHQLFSVGKITSFGV